MADPFDFPTDWREIKALESELRGKTTRPVDQSKMRVKVKPQQRKQPEIKVVPMPSVANTARSALSIVQNAPAALADLAVSVPKAAYNYVRTSTPSKVVADVKRGASGLVDYVTENPAEAFVETVAGTPKAVGEMFREATLARDAGDVARAEQIEKFAVPMLLGSLIPGGRAAKGAAKGAAKAEKSLVTKAEKPLAVKPTKPETPAPKPKAKAAAPEAKRPDVLKGANSPFMVSTRRPTAPNYAAFGNPDEELLVQTGEALRAAPDAFKKNMQMLAEEPFMANFASTDPEAIYQEALQRGADNLSFIVTDLMDPERAATTKEWYPSAQMISERAASRAGLPPQAGYGVTAVTSPQTPWDINVARLDRMMDMYGDRFETDPAAARRYIQQRLESRSPGAIAMRGPDYAERIAAMPYEELSDKFDKFARVSLADATRNDPMVRKISLSGEYGEPYGNITWGSGDVINKSLSILDDPSMENINAQLLGGGKVPSFYDNIADPFAPAPIVTIDTHSAGAASLFPGGGNDPIVYRGMGLGPSGKGMPPAAADVARTGSKGLYGPLSDMHVIAGQRLGMLPREVQSATWEGVRDLWGQSGKTPALKQAIADIWRNSSSPDEARFRIAELLGRPVKRVFQVK